MLLKALQVLLHRTATKSYFGVWPLAPDNCHATSTQQDATVGAQPPACRDIRMPFRLLIRTMYHTNKIYFWAQAHAIKFATGPATQDCNRTGPDLDPRAHESPCLRHASCNSGVHRRQIYFHKPCYDSATLDMGYHEEA